MAEHPMIEEGGAPLSTTTSTVLDPSSRISAAARSLA
jgi:hypothetical protein